MEDLEGIRRKKLQELQQRLQEEGVKEEYKMQLEQQRRSLLMEILTPEARGRLANIKVAKPEFASQIEDLLIQLVQSGQLKQQITDAQLKQVLLKISGGKREIKIRRM